MAKKPFVLQVGIYSALRRMFRRWPGYSEVLNRCKKEFFIKSKKGSDMRRVHFQCEECGDKVDRKKFAVDHIEPVIPLEGLPIVNGLPDYNVYIARLFCSKDNLQGLCESCHKEKTKLENALRRKLKKPEDKIVVKETKKKKLAKRSK
jgi:5-methylcytosine-specific restriction endonuclease McrA